MMEIYLTKMILNPRSRQVRNEMGNPQELHRTISRGFPKIENEESLPKHLNKTPRNEFNILHRLDIDRRLGKAVLLVQSTAKPDWEFLKDYAEEIKCKPIHDQYSAIENGMNLLFRLQANPTKRIGNSDTIAHERFKESKNRRRVELRTDEERIKWLMRKGDEVGFRLANVNVAPTVPNVASVEEGKINFRKERSSPKITFGSVIFEGVLQVTDAEKFKEALKNGIGTGKAYGFGLLSVAPVKET